MPSTSTLVMPSFSASTGTVEGRRIVSQLKWITGHCLRRVMTLPPVMQEAAPLVEPVANLDQPTSDKYKRRLPFSLMQSRVFDSVLLSSHVRSMPLMLLSLAMREIFDRFFHGAEFSLV